MSDRITLLIVESDAVFAEHLTSVLLAAGYLVAGTSTGRNGLCALFHDRPHLVLLGYPLSDMDSSSALRRIREVSDIPIVVVAKRNRLGQRLRALELGAQDYIAEPFEMQELVLRVRAALHNCPAQRQGRPVTYDDGVLRVDGVWREVTVHGRGLSVTAPEMSLLALLARKPGCLVTYDDVFDALPWLAGENHGTALRSLVHRLRRKLEQAAAGSDYILTQHSLGIRLNVQKSPL
jgi:two-component system, OmpR family, KDP operon response regulator KdpE